MRLLLFVSGVSLLNAFQITQFSHNSGVSFLNYILVKNSRVTISKKDHLFEEKNCAFFEETITIIFSPPILCISRDISSYSYMK